MFRKPPHDKAERPKFFGLTKETKDIPTNDKQMLSMVENTLSMFGSSFSDSLKVEKFVGPDMTKTDEYTAIRPGVNNQ